MRLRNQPKLPNINPVNIVILCLVVGMDVWFIAHRPLTEASGHDPVRTYSAVQLSLHDGTDRNLPVLIAMDGLVYDVSAGRTEYYDPGKPYHMLAGTDATALLRIAGGDIIARKYPVIGRFTP